MGKLKYSIKSISPSVVEVGVHQVSYVLGAEEKSSFELKAIRDGSVMERASWRVRGKSVEIEVSGRDRRRMIWKSTFTASTARTEVSLGRRRYRVRSSLKQHGVELARTLGKLVGPEVRYIGWLMKDLRQHRAFRLDVRGRLPGLGVVNGGPMTLACIAACACCGFAPVDGPIAPPCCVVCFGCMLE